MPAISIMERGIRYSAKRKGLLVSKDRRTGLWGIHDPDGQAISIPLETIERKRRMACWSSKGDERGWLMGSGMTPIINFISERRHSP